MRLLSVGASGYRPFPPLAAPNPLELRPLTLVFGKNNVGKSALVRLPYLLLGGLEAKTDEILPLNVRHLRFADRFVELVHGQDFFQPATFLLGAENAGISLDLEVTLFNADALSTDGPPKVWSYRLMSPVRFEVTEPDLTGGLGFKGLLPAKTEFDAWRSAASTLLDEGVHLGPTRPQIQRSYPRFAVPPYPRPSDAPQRLSLDRALEDQVGRWFEEYLDGWRVRVNHHSTDDFKLEVARFGRNRVNLADAGQGLQQVLPVVVHQHIRRSQGGLEFVDVIEQPELHLHAAAQAPLADLLLDTARANPRSVTLVETHAEPILLRVQRRVAEGLDESLRDLIAIYFVEDRGAEGSRIGRVGITRDGELEGWPDGVFDEDFREVAAIRRAQRKRGAP